MTPVEDTIVAEILANCYPRISDYIKAYATCADLGDTRTATQTVFANRSQCER